MIDEATPLTSRTEDTEVRPAAASCGPPLDPRGGDEPPSAAAAKGGFPRPCADDGSPAFEWNEAEELGTLYAELGGRLAEKGDIYRNPRHAGGLLLASPCPRVPPTPILTALQLARLMVDRLKVVVKADGKIKGRMVPATHLNVALGAETFLQQFPVVDLVTRVPTYLPGYRLTAPGYNDGGPGHHVFYTGTSAAVASGTDALDRFLDAMAFATAADRTNTVAAALTVLLRTFWPGGKPLIAVTATKSHAGKETIVTFAAGNARVTGISFQATDWALERAFVGAATHHPDTAVIDIDNARLGRGAGFITSSFLERFLTDPEPLLFSTGTGKPASRVNDLVLALTTNYAMLGTDLMNRSLPIHLAPTGNIEDRKSPIGNPKLEYLPAHRDQIEAELRGLIGRWCEAGCPPDPAAHHPFSLWARTVGGILQVAGYADFLGNYAVRKAVDDPVRKALGILGAAATGRWLGAEEWSKIAVDQGLVPALVACDADRHSESGRCRGLGLVLTHHRDETFRAETNDETLVLKLEKARRRFERSTPATRYRFAVLERSPLPCDEDPAAQPEAVDPEHGSRSN